MTAQQQLRNSILQQAIQGRLVPQDPNDEPASVVIDKSLYKGKISILQEEEYPVEIPSNWCFCRLQDVAITIGGYAFKSDELKGNIGTRVIRISDVTPSGFSNKNIVRYNNNLLLEQYEVHEDDILIAMTGGTVGKSLYVDNLPERLLLNQRVAIVRAENIYPLYLDLVIKSPLTQDIVSERKNSTNDNISMVDIKGFPIPLPPLAEQRRIVAKIEELMPLVEKYGKAQTELDTLNQDLPRRLRQSVLQQAIQGKLVEQDEKDEWSNIFVSKLPKKKYKTNAEWPCEEPFDLPNGWNWCHIGDVCEILNGYAFKSGNYVDSGIRIMRISNVQAGVIVDKDPKFYPLSSEADIKDYVLKEGDMLMSLTGNVGRVGILKADMLPAALNQRVACLRLHNEEIKPFFYHYLQSEIFRMRCESSGHGMAQLNISTEWLKQELIPLPPLAEQRRIVAKIEELFAEIDKLK